MIYGSTNSVAKDLLDQVYSGEINAENATKIILSKYEDVLMEWLKR